VRHRLLLPLLSTSLVRVTAHAAACVLHRGGGGVFSLPPPFTCHFRPPAIIKPTLYVSWRHRSAAFACFNATVLFKGHFGRSQLQACSALWVPFRGEAAF
jgi:hypothetical protein